MNTDVDTEDSYEDVRVPGTPVPKFADPLVASPKISPVITGRRILEHSISAQQWGEQIGQFQFQESPDKVVEQDDESVDDDCNTSPEVSAQVDLETEHCDEVDGGNSSSIPGGVCSPASSSEGQRNDGYLSPASSQGSESSMEFLHKQVTSIKRKSELLQTVEHSTAWTCVPQSIHKLLRSFTQDRHEFGNLMRTIKHSLLSLAFRSGIEPGSKESNILEENLRSLDQQKLAAVVARYMICSQYPVILPDVLSQSGNTEEEPSNRPSKRAKLEEDDYPVAPDLPEEPITPKFQVSNESIWEKAEYAFLNETSETRKIEKVGQVFFDDIMTREELKTQTFSGKRGTQKFDEGKLQWIRACCGYIWLRPPKNKRNTAAFELEWGNGLQDLDISLWEVVKKKVFSEHAYRERKKLIGREYLRQT